MTLDVTALVWDVDGVLVYVGESYRRAIIETTQYYLNNIIGLELKNGVLSLEDTQNFKLATGFNNDWEITYGAVLCFLTKVLSELDVNKGVDLVGDLAPLWGGRDLDMDLGSVLQETGERGGGLGNLREVLKRRYRGSASEAERFWHRDKIKQIFQEMYLGEGLYLEKYGVRPEFMEGRGFIWDETPLASRELLSELSGRCVMGIASGREHFEIDAVLGMHDFREFFVDDFIVGGDDFPSGKPDPSQLLECKRRIEAKKGLVDNEKVAYVGDVPDDVIAARRAGFRSIGVTASVRDAVGKEKLRQRLKELNADYVIDGLDELKGIL